MAGAFCELAAGVPGLCVVVFVMALRPSRQAAFLLYSLRGFATLLLYRRLPPEVPGAIAQDAKPLRQSRRIVLMLAALFSLDAFAGGLIVQSLLALWLFERFGLSLATAGAIFFWTDRKSTRLNSSH